MPNPQKIKLVWKDIEQFPEIASSSQWSIYQGKTERKSSKSEIKSIISNKYAFGNSLLIGFDRKRLLPPIFFNELEDDVVKFVKSNSKRMVVIPLLAGLMVVIITTLYSSVSVNKILQASDPFFLLSFVVLQDYLINLRKKLDLIERCLFIRYIRQSNRTRKIISVWFFLLMVMGLLEFGLVTRYNSLELVFQKFGLMYSSVGNGEYWGFITGPFLHYFINMFQLLLFVVIGSIVKIRAMLVIFIAGSIGSLYLQYLLGGRVYDSAGGISGGVYALSGFIFALSFHPAKLFGKGIPTYAFLASLSSVFMGIVWSQNAANIAHFSGLIFGCVVGGVLSFMWIPVLSNECLVYTSHSKEGSL